LIGSFPTEVGQLTLVGEGEELLKPEITLAYDYFNDGPIV